MEKLNIVILNLSSIKAVGNTKEINIGYWKFKYQQKYQTNKNNGIEIHP